MSIIRIIAIILVFVAIISFIHVSDVGIFSINYEFDKNYIFNGKYILYLLDSNFITNFTDCSVIVNNFLQKKCKVDNRKIEVEFKEVLVKNLKINIKFKYRVSLNPFANNYIIVYSNFLKNFTFNLEIIPATLLWNVYRNDVYPNQPGYVACNFTNGKIYCYGTRFGKIVFYIVPIINIFGINISTPKVVLLIALSIILIAVLSGLSRRNFNFA